MKLHLRLASMALIAIAALVASCGDKATNPTSNPPPLELNSGNMPAGRSYSHLFANAGTYNYFCTIHGASMSGSITVSGTTPDSVLVTIGPGNSYNPATASVKVMGTVRWINVGSPHTVTSN